MHTNDKGSFYSAPQHRWAESSIMFRLPGALKKSHEQINFSSLTCYSISKQRRNYGELHLGFVSRVCAVSSLIFLACEPENNSYTIYPYSQHIWRLRCRWANIRNKTSHMSLNSKPPEFAPVPCGFQFCHLNTQSKCWSQIHRFSLTHNSTGSELA